MAKEAEEKSSGTLAAIGAVRRALRLAASLLALGAALAVELLRAPRCIDCYQRRDPGLMRQDGRCAPCHRAARRPS